MLSMFEKSNVSSANILNNDVTSIGKLYTLENKRGSKTGPAMAKFDWLKQFFINVDRSMVFIY